MGRRKNARSSKPFVARRAVAGTLAAVAAVAAAAWFLSTLPRHGGHPEPRAGVTNAHVLHGAAIPHAAGAAESYAAAYEMPAILDGVRCYCACSVTIGHRSLLSCFEDEHGANCQVCQDEAIITRDAVARGATLREVRQAVEARFGPPT